MTAHFITSVQEAPDIFTFHFKPEKKVDYTAGQFIDLTIPHEADERGNRRWFTLSSSPTEETISITTRIAGKDGSSFKRQLQKLKPGDSVVISDPMGDFVLPIDKNVPVTFVAAGIGITPVRSMVKSLYDTQQKRPIRLIYAVHTPKDAAFSDVFAAYGLSTHVFTTASNGRLDGPGVLEISPDDGKTLYYLSGPEPMVEKLVAELEAAGVEKSRLVTDYFLNYQSI